MTQQYSRTNPSAKHLELLAYYKTMHEQGHNVQANDGTVTHVNSEDAYPGRMLPLFIQPIKQMVDLHKAKTLIDYGAGKGMQYQLKNVKDSQGLVHENIQSYWGVTEIFCYDPALEDFSALPGRKFDGLVSTDVLEHCSPVDVPWIVREMFSLADKFLFVNINCMPAAALLPSGENAHIMLRHPEWWSGFFTAISEDFPDVDFLLCCVARVLEANKPTYEKTFFYKRDTRHT